MADRLGVLNAAQRVIIGHAQDGTGFVSEAELSPTQIIMARQMAKAGWLKGAGTEPDGTRVYQPTDRARKAFEAR